MNPPAPAASGVSNCYVFKSRLQEYTQKTGLATPVYETTKEGPPHEPTFRSAVTVDNVSYDSLPGFYNRKAAEQSAAEVAFLAILGSGGMSQFVPHPVHETGLCKNLLQEYAQKMNYAIPCYSTSKAGIPGNLTFACTVEIGGIRYIGAAAKTKKEAEIKAARTALLAIHSSTSPSGINGEGEPIYTVLPFKKKTKESEEQNVVKSLKPKKAKLKKKSKMKFHQMKAGNSTTNLDGNTLKDAMVALDGPVQVHGDIDQHLHRQEEVSAEPDNDVSNPTTVYEPEQVSGDIDQNWHHAVKVLGDIHQHLSGDIGTMDNQHLCPEEQVIGEIDRQLHQSNIYQVTIMESYKSPTFDEEPCLVVKNLNGC